MPILTFVQAIMSRVIVGIVVILTAIGLGSLSDSPTNPIVDKEPTQEIEEIVILTEKTEELAPESTPTEDNLPAGGEKILINEENSPTSTSGDGEEITPTPSPADVSSTEEGYIDFGLEASEFFGDECDMEKRYIYDVTNPEINFSFPKYNDKLSGTVPLQASVEDKGSFKSGIKSVTFYLRDGASWNSLGTGEKNDEKAVYSQNYRKAAPSVALGDLRQVPQRVFVHLYGDIT